MRGQRNDRNRDAQGTDRAGGFLAVHLGHRDVHKNHVGPEALAQVHRDAAIVGKDEVDVMDPHHLLKHQLVGPVVFRRKHPHLAQRAGRWRFGNRQVGFKRCG